MSFVPRGREIMLSDGKARPAINALSICFVSGPVFYLNLSAASLRGGI